MKNLTHICFALVLLIGVNLLSDYAGATKFEFIEPLNGTVFTKQNISFKVFYSEVDSFSTAFAEIYLNNIFQLSRELYLVSNETVGWGCRDCLSLSGGNNVIKATSTVPENGSCYVIVYYGNTALRDLIDEEAILPGLNFTVKITVPDEVSVVQIKEKWCNGWNYVNSSLNESQVQVNESGNEIVFAINGEKSFIYVMRAPDTYGCCNVEGIYGTIPIEKMYVCTHNPCELYDIDESGCIELNEAVAAVIDYFDLNIDLNIVVQVIQCYFSCG